MKFKAEIDIMPLETLLDPQGKAVANSMLNIGIPEIEYVRIGRHIQLIIEAESESQAREKIDESCRKILVNQIMEKYSFVIEQIDNVGTDL